ncbi:transcription antitermination factor NusB, partial [Flavobacteriaceae bacterium]|nr:transcription antitermination factor NusB [Flavobacteriaceae bacterium]
WYSHSELISSIWNDIIESEISFKFLNDENKSFELDKSYLTNLFRKVIASNKKLYDFFEDTEISWINDLPLVNSLVLSSIKNSKKSSKNILLMTDIYKNDEDAEFGVKLLKSVINNKETLQDHISKITLNWDNDRIAQIDLILLEMCLAEFLFFKSIPVKASINEYLEIAKEYSSKKSNIFINGILDKLSKDLTKNGTIKKNKRGMQ